MQQTKTESAIEISLNYLSGFILAYLIYAWVILPTENLKDSPFWVTVIFTVVSIVRSYFWRRFFNAGLNHVFMKLKR